MAYIDYAYYSNEFRGSKIREEDFDRLAEAASDIVDAICGGVDLGIYMEGSRFKKAIAYEVELLNAEGGIDAITGQAASSMSSTSEHLDDYTITTSRSQAAMSGQYSFNGLPVSPITVSLLKSIGAVKSRWVYEGLVEPYGF